MNETGTETPPNPEPLRQNPFTRWMGVGSALAIVFLLLALYFLVQGVRPRTYRLTITGGDSLGKRHALAELLREEAGPRGLRLTVRDSNGSAEALQQVQAGKLDLALVQGGLPAPKEVRLVAALHVEPLHLLVKKELAEQGLPGLRGKRINLSTAESGTRLLATQVLRFAGMEAGADFTPKTAPTPNSNRFPPGRCRTLSSPFLPCPRRSPSI
ncbi:MAG: hypothetical protein OHK0029_23080 [Armatimonadaceae bacterium]